MWLDEKKGKCVKKCPVEKPAYPPRVPKTIGNKSGYCRELKTRRDCCQHQDGTGHYERQPRCIPKITGNWNNHETCGTYQDMVDNPHCKAAGKDAFQYNYWEHVYTGRYDMNVCKAEPKAPRRSRFV